MIDGPTAMVRAGADRWLTFRDPALVLRADAPDGVRRVISDVERLTRDHGLHAVGFVAYEAAAAFDLAVHPAPDDLPLAWFAFFEPSRVSELGRVAAAGEYRIDHLRPSISQDAFAEAFDRIKSHLAGGDTYQVNFTFRLEGGFEGDALALFADVCESQRGDHAVYLDLGRYAICSASPELFFQFRGAEIHARPMKGTARRGLTPETDRAIAAGLAASDKNRAENVMIVDMVRNDLGRVAEVGSVGVPELFTVERYPNVWQMTSLVTARSSAPLADVFEALHPSASVTGAPKVRTMELLSGLERGPRGVYTGAMGHVPPDGMASFNVAIRTAVVDRERSLLSFGIGSGIVWDSDAAAEYAECLLKGSVVGQRPRRFELLETLKWVPGEGYVLLGRHLDRLAASADYFGIPLRLSAVHAALGEAADPAEQKRVRLLVDQHGGIRTESAAFVKATEPVRVALAARPVSSSDVFLYHKTTRREVYDEALHEAHGADDVVLWNQDGDITESTTANLIVDLDGELVTPPVSCGLLAGTLRADLIGRGQVRERRVTREELRQARELWLANSVQGLRRARLVERA